MSAVGRVELERDVVAGGIRPRLVEEEGRTRGDVDGGRVVDHDTAHHRTQEVVDANLNRVGAVRNIIDAVATVDVGAGVEACILVEIVEEEDGGTRNRL